jgi:hypothetical protein
LHLAAQERHFLGLAVFGRIGLEELGAHDLAVDGLDLGHAGAGAHVFAARVEGLDQGAPEERD